jgi:hypothetical protein
MRWARCQRAAQPQNRYRCRFVTIGRLPAGHISVRIEPDLVNYEPLCWCGGRHSDEEEDWTPLLAFTRRRAVSNEED